MKHASHKATTVSHQKFSLAKTLSAFGKGSHSVRTVCVVQSVGSDAVVSGLDPAIAEKINEIVPQTRRSIREAARAVERHSHIPASALLAALVGTAAGALAFSNNEDATNSFVVDPATTTTQTKRISDVATVSRFGARTDLSSSSVTVWSTNEGGWGLNNLDSTLDVKSMNHNNADNPVASALVDADDDAVPTGFNPNHAVGTNSNNYPWGQCVWYAYQRRAELGLPSNGNFGNGGEWAASIFALGYRVDNTPRHVGDAVVFVPGQANVDGTYGHVAVLEKINTDGPIEISEPNAKGLGVVSTRTSSAIEVGKLQYIHH